MLVNGRRLGVGSPYTAIQSPAPDLDQIPTALVERVDVVTGGASAVYGSDAIAGVINFIMKQNFEGFQVDYHVGENWHENHSDYARAACCRTRATIRCRAASTTATTMTVNIIAGTNFADDKGNVTAYFGYMKSDPVCRAADRDFGGCQLSLNATTSTARSAPARRTRTSFQLTGTAAPVRRARQPVRAVGHDAHRESAGVLQLAAVHLHGARRTSATPRASWGTST